MNQLDGVAFDSQSAGAILNAPYQMLLGDDLISQLPGFSHLGYRVSAFDVEGRIFDPLVKDKGRFVELAAVPHGVLVIAAGAATAPVAKRLQEFFRRHYAHHEPRLVILQDEASAAFVLAREFSSALAAHAHELTGFLAARDEETTRLRQEVEWLQLRLAQGKRMVEAIGYSTRVLSYEASPGSATIAGDNALVQRLPVDVAGLSAVSLHLSARAPRSGTLIVDITPADLTRSLAKAEIPYRNLRQGWNDFFLPSPVGAEHGDGFMTLAFHSQ